MLAFPFDYTVFSSFFLFRAREVWTSYNDTIIEQVVSEKFKYTAKYGVLSVMTVDTGFSRSFDYLLFIIFLRIYYAGIFAVVA